MNTQEPQTLDIPLKKLLAWDHNMRTTNPDQGVQELAASIRSMGLLQSVVVKKAPRGKFAVVAGRRRLLALSLLSESGDIPVSFEVPCRLLLEDADLTEISLAENFHHEPPHPADEFEAFSKLLTAGESVVDIAARFGVTEAVVLRRLALGRVNPSLIQEYRDGALNLEMLQAFTLTDDQQLQAQGWNQLTKQHWNHNASTIRSLLSQSAIPVSDKRVRFVGLEIYEARGGLVRRDLFAEGENGVYIEDAVLLDQLVANKLATLSGDLQSEGWKWVEILPEADHRVTGRMRRLPPAPEPLAPKRQAKLDALRQELADLEQQLFTDDGETDMRGPVAEIRRNEIENRLKRGLPVNATALAEVGLA
jgi:ParB family transcriptional regulator, chromosome partitioning protein